MDERVPSTEPCLTPSERRELQAAWADLQAALDPMADLIDRADGVDCGPLHAAFVGLADKFEKVEHLVMRAQQVRLLHHSHTEDAGD